MLDFSPVQLFISSVLFILAFFTLFGVSRVVCGAHIRLIAPWATRLLSQWILHWWRVSGSTACEPFPCADTARGWIGRKYDFLFLRNDQTGIRTHPTSFGGACSTNALV